MPTNYLVKQGDHLTKIARAYGFADYKTIWNAPENQKLKNQRKNPNVLYAGDNLFIPDKETKEESRATDKKHSFELQRDKLMLRIVLLDLDRKPMAGQNCTLIVETDSQDFTTKSDGLVEEEISEKAATGKLRDKGKSGTSPPTERDIPLKIGHLNPVDTVSGQIARLNNLGYNAGDPNSPPAAPASASAHDPNLSGANSPNASDPNVTGSDPNATAGLTDAQARAAKQQADAAEQLESAIEEFQCDFMGNNDLATIQQVVDGICGPKTQAKLLEIHGS
jgi:N-acetylmuramoyl-L-alanine amidase